MKFLCGSCRTKYQISDEKVRGKILTIRCKKCGAKIIVRESLVRAAGGRTAVAPVAEAPPTVVEDRAVAAGRAQLRPSGSTALVSAYEGAMHHPGLGSGPEPDDALTGVSTGPVHHDTAGSEWYLAIQGVQHGPLAFAELVRKLRLGEVVARHYVWRDGMEGWSRVGDVEALAGYFASPRKQPPPPPAALHAAVAADRTTGRGSAGEVRTTTGPSLATRAEVVDSTETRPERSEGALGSETHAVRGGRQAEIVEAEANSPDPAEGADMLDQVLNEALGIEGEGANRPTPAKAAEPTEVDARKATGEHARVGGSVSFDRLLPFEDKEDIFANVPYAGETEEGDAVPESTRFFVAAAGVNKRKSRNIVGVVAGLAVIFALGVFVVAWATGFFEVEIPGIGNPFYSDPRERIVADDGREVDEDVDELKKQLAGDPRGRRPRGTKPRERRRNVAGTDFVSDRPEETTLSSRGADDVPTYEVGAPKTGGGLGGAHVGDAKLPSSGVEQIQPVERRALDESAVARIVRQRRKSVSICYEQSLRGREDLRGKLEFVVTIRPSGGVSRVRVRTVAFRGSRLGRCIADKIKDWRFPPFSGEAQDVVVPFVLEKGSY